jgi:hypothetical protein
LAEEQADSSCAMTWKKSGAFFIFASAVSALKARLCALPHLPAVPDTGYGTLQKAAT